jgi:CubicO group peptidase (beta-lactamase class C family)
MRYNNILIDYTGIMALNEKFYNIFHDQIVGGNVVFIKNQDEIKYHYGYRSLLDNKPTEDDTIYRIASISKLVIG